jgi:cytidine deaminase
VISNFNLDQLHSEAIKARNHAHAPYSKFKVGAAIRLSTGEVFSGCNVENASYGGTVCAERVAIWKGVSDKGAGKISDVLVVTDQKDPWPPCGFCRQVIAEFATSTTMVHLADLKSVHRSLKFSDLLPESFTPDHLKT